MTSTFYIAQGPWHLIREFAGIYNLPVDYKKIKDRYASEIQLAAQLTGAISRQLLLSIRGGIGRNPQRFIDVIMKHVTQSQKKREFYMEMANIISTNKFSKVIPKHISETRGKTLLCKYHNRTTPRRIKQV